MRRNSVPRIARGPAFRLPMAGLLLAGLTDQAGAALQLSMQSTPDPATPGEALDVRITVSNPDAFTRSGVVLSLPYPGELATLGEATISHNGRCDDSVGNNSNCEAGEILSWSLPDLPAQTGFSVSLPPIVDTAVTAGTDIPFSLEVTDSTNELVSLVHALPVTAQRVLQVGLDADRDPAIPGDTIRYRVTYGHSATSAASDNAQLSLQVPSDLTLVTATGGGVPVGDTVAWSLGTLAPGEGGEHTATFLLDPGAVLGGSLIAEAALTDANGQPTRTDRVTRVQSEAPLQIAIEPLANPAEPGAVTEYVVSIGNTSGFDRADVAVSLRYPTGFADVAEGTISDGGACDDSIGNNANCQARETLTWALPEPLPGGSGYRVSMPPTVATDLAQGSVISLTAEVTDSSGLRVATDRSLLVQSDRVLEMAVDEDREPALPGGTLTYIVHFGHSATSTVAENAALHLRFPPQLSLLSASDGATLTGDSVEWTLGTLTPGQGGERRATFTVDPAASLGSLLNAEFVLLDDSAAPTRIDSVTRVQSEAPLAIAVASRLNPAQPAEVVGYGLTIGNTSLFDRADLRLSLRYPLGLADVAEGTISDDGRCDDSVGNNANCQAVETLFWELPTLPAGTGITYTLPPEVADSLAEGTLIPLTAQIEDSSGLRVTTAHSVLVQNQRVLQLAVDTDQSPVVPGNTLRYTLTYGHSATSAVATDSVLELGIPQGLTLSATTGGGTQINDRVQWSLGTLVPGQGGERSATFEVDANATPGSLLQADAVLTDTNGKPTRLDAVTRVENEVPLTVMVHAAPTAAQPGETLDVALTVSNTSPFERAGVRLHLRYPQGLNTLAETAISDGGVCDDSVGNNANCEPLETVIWDFATLAPGAEVTVSLPPVVSTQPEGSLIAFDAWVQDSLDRSRASDTVRIGDPEPVSDSDGDGIADDIDNCTADSNADQLDSDGDGYGNQCDTDLNNDGIANILDLGLFKLALRTDDPAADFNGDGLVDELDRTIFRDRFLTAPGPSALAP